MRIKHCFQRFAAVMACLMLGMFCLPGAAHAAGYVQLTDAQLEAKCTLTLEYPLSGTAFQLYKVADMDRNVRFTPTEAFKDYPVFSPNEDGSVKINELDSEGWTSLANTLAGYAARDSETLEPAAVVTTDADGMAAALDLPAGLYLVVGAVGYQGDTRYTPAPFLAALPTWDGQSWGFDVSAEAKYTTYTPAPDPGPGSGSDPEPDTIQRRALKIWEDEGFENERPSQITVDLLRDGEVYDTAVLSAGNNWRASWTDLSPNYQWQLVEREGEENYVVSVALEGITFTVTNTYVESMEDDDPPLAEIPEVPEDPGTPEIPDELIDLGDDDPPLDGGPGSGDEGQIDVEDEELIDIEDEDPPLADLPQTGQLWWPVPLLALAGAGLLAVGFAKRGKQSDDAQ